MLIDWLPQALQRLCHLGRQSSVRQRKARPAATVSTVEQLEGRALMSASSYGADQYAPAYIDPILTSAIEGAVAAGALPVGSSSAPKTLADYIARDNNGRVGVRVVTNNVTGVAAQLSSLGFTATALRPNQYFVEGFISPSMVSSLSGISGVRGVLPIYLPISRAGSVTSQADSVLQSDRVRETFPPGYDGTGVTIGIISDSFNAGGANPIRGVNTGDLPYDIKILSDGTFGMSDEGRAMGELIHDIAPGASLSFATGIMGEAGFAQAILDLANPALGNADIIVDDLGYLTEPFFQDGIISQAINQVVNNQGITYFTAVGNDGNNSYETTSIGFQPDDQFFFPLPGSWLDFDSGTGATNIDVRNQVNLLPGQNLFLSLQWDDPFYTANGVDTDLDIFIVDSFTGQILASSTSNNIATQTPNEIVFYEAGNGFFGQTVDIMVRLESGPVPGRIKWIDAGSGVAPEFDTASSATYGHVQATGAISVAASPYFDAYNTAVYSSEGGTPILFTPTGSPLGVSQSRQAPTITSIDGTNTSFFTGGIFSDGIDVEKDGTPNFFGTSAAAPHAAAVAALLKQANPGLTPAQIRQRLIDTATDIEATGYDFNSGFGLINAYRAVLGDPINATVNFTENNESGNLNGAWEVNSFGSGSVTQTTQYGGTAGSTSLILRSSLDGADRLSMDSFLTDPTTFSLTQEFFEDLTNSRLGALSEAILHLDLSGQTEDVFLSFGAKQSLNALIPTVPSGFSNDLQEPMSRIFQGHEASDGVAISVDGGTTWYRLKSLIDENIGANFVNSKINLTQFANQNGFALGSNVQIKFQQFDQLGSVFAFDFGGQIQKFSFFNPPIKSNNPAGVFGIETNAIILDNIQVFTNLGPVVTTTPGVINHPADALAVVVDPGITVQDPESPNFDGGTLTVSILSGGVAGDRLEIKSMTTGSVATRITTQGNRVLYGGAEIGTFTGGALGMPLNVILNQNATPAITQALMRQITFRTNSNLTGQITIQFVLTDGEGGTSSPVTKVIDISAGGNTAPVITLTPDSLTVSRGATAVQIQADAIVTDLDSTNFDGGELSVKITTNLSSSDRIEVKNFGNGSGLIGVSGSLIKYGGVQIGTLTGTPSARIIKLNSNATLAAVQALVQAITFRTISSSAPIATRTVQFRLTDGDGGTSAFANKSVNVVTKNTAPVLTLKTTIPTFDISTATPILIESLATVSDSDSTDFNGGQLTVRITANGTSNDRIAIRNQGASAGRISVSGTSVLYGGIVIGTATGGTGTAPLVITFNQNANAAATRALVRNLTFATTGSGTLALQQRTLSLQLTDGDGGTSKAVTKKISVRA